MRAVVTSLIALILSGFAGGMVVQLIAQTTGATEEFIIAFTFVPLFTMLATVIFFVAQLAGARGGVDRTARWLAALYLLAVVALFGFEFWADAGNLELGQRALPLLGALVLSGLIVLLVQWIFVRSRSGPAAPPP